MYNCIEDDELWPTYLFFIFFINLHYIPLQKKSKSKIGNRSQGWLQVSLFDSYYTKV